MAREDATSRFALSRVLTGRTNTDMVIVENRPVASWHGRLTPPHSYACALRPPRFQKTSAAPGCKLGSIGTSKKTPAWARVELGKRATKERLWSGSV